MENSELLKIENLCISFLSERQKKEVIHNISFHINKNEILAIVGESGSGKSVSSLAIMGLFPIQVSEITNGSIVFEGNELVNLSVKDFQKIRGNEISMIF